MANEITAQHAKALDLHNRIMVSAQLVQTNLWDMCNGLKEMRDGKLMIYKKFRGQRQVVYRKYLTEQLLGKKLLTGHVFFVNSGEIEPEVLDEMEEVIRGLAGGREIHRAIAGCTISSHCGPGTLAVFYIGQ